MKLSEIYQKKKFTYSFEVFPPKQNSSIESVYKTLDALLKMKELNPDFISVTYGAGGSMQDNKTLELSSLVKNRLGIETMAHLTCVRAKRADIEHTLSALREAGIDNVLALRGDVPEGDAEGDFAHADELVAFIKSFGDFHVSVACYPEVHPEALSKEADLDWLKRKVDAGADHLITQLFFDNNTFYDFMNRVRAKGITQPVEAGIMPVVNKKQILRTVSMCGAKFPPKFNRIVEKFGDSAEALYDAGIAYAVDQIIDLIASGVDGIHLYTMNNPKVAASITGVLSGIMNQVNDHEHANESR